MKKLYSINSRLELETFSIIDEHNLNDGATVETYLCIDKNGVRFTCSKDMYCHSEKEAWSQKIREYKNGIVRTKEGIRSLIKDIINFEKAIKKLKINLSKSLDN